MTGCVCEKVAQNEAQSVQFVKINKTVFGEKMAKNLVEIGKL
jgi:hypothetical protein